MISSRKFFSGKLPFILSETFFEMQIFFEKLSHNPIFILWLYILICKTYLKEAKSSKSFKEFKREIKECGLGTAVAIYANNLHFVVSLSYYFMLDYIMFI